MPLLCFIHLDIMISVKLFSGFDGSLSSEVTAAGSSVVLLATVIMVESMISCYSSGTISKEVLRSSG